VDLWRLFYMGVDLREVSAADYDPGRRTLSRAEERACLLRLGSIPSARFVDSLPREEMDALLRKYLGLGLDETNRRGLEWTYLPETDSFVHARNEGNWRSWPLRYGYEKGDEVCLFYESGVNYLDGQSGLMNWTSADGIFRVVLRREGGGVRFVSNLRPLYNGTDSVFEAPDLPAAVPANYTGDYGRDVTLLSFGVEDFGSYEAARASVDGMTYPVGEEEYPFDEKLVRDYPGWGTLIYGEISAGLPHGSLSHLYFLTADGRRCELPTPQYGMGDLEMDLSEDGRGAEEGWAYALLDSGPDTVCWWISCEYETWVQLGLPSRQDGRAYYTLYLPTMEVFICFRPEG
jgi:hypothetical protein